MNAALMVSVASATAPSKLRNIDAAAKYRSTPSDRYRFIH
ncbi:hypothetical protein FBY40_0179 [Microbacterium sp. SLBN-154]|nr:hypothetical protein FBY40_0179 [Microbacterium sp. SLBN-154]